MKTKYPASAYDDNLCLKISFETWAAILFLIRPYVILVLSLANRSDRMGLINLFYPTASGMPLAATAALPVMVLLFAWIKRKPGAHASMRWIWRHGKSFLLASSVLGIGIALQPLAEENRLGPIGWMQLTLYLAVVIYLLTSSRVKDTFTDYP